MDAAVTRLVERDPDFVIGYCWDIVFFIVFF
jgi:hypothetical protein